MQVDLSSNEIRIIDEALTAWEKEKQGSAMISSIFGVILSPKEEKEESRLKMEAEMKAAEDTGRQRHRQGIMLRAKLYQAEAKISEHEVA